MMENIVLKVEKLEHCAGLPEYKTEGAAGMDLMAANTEDVVLKPLDRALIPTGIKIELPRGYEAQIRPRSGLAIKSGITLSNCVGTIDEDYRGEVCVGLINLSREEFTIKRGDRIAQMLIAPVVRADIQVLGELSATARGTGGFGSTGV
ncbi:MAG: dUTP diphosphatase [Candidatus Gastranaerophilales bacterium]|nr:dUTP diphosphatase [Candidatus Gastranaerophilales bacterium]